MLSKYGDWSKFNSTFSPMQVTRFSQFPDRCVTGTAPTVYIMGEGYGHTSARAWLKTQFAALNEACGPATKMNNYQLDSLINTIAAEYYFLKCTEIMLFISMFRAGKFGHFFGNVDPLVITTALGDFVSWRSEVLAKEQARLAKEQARNIWTGKEQTRTQYLASLPEDQRKDVAAKLDSLARGQNGGWLKEVANAVKTN